MRLKKFDYKIRENKKKPIIISIAIIMILLIGVTIYTSFAQYTVTKSYNILQGEVKEFDQGDVQIAVTLVDKEGNEKNTDKFPKTGYTYDSERSSCENGSTIEFDEETWTASVTTNKKDKCTFYFNEIVTLYEAIMLNSTLVNTTPDFSVVDTESNNKLYKTEDDLGTSYYFRGATTNNYVKFAQDNSGNDMYWRIIRINGDGSIRLIYDGTETVENGVAHTATIGASAFNTSYNDAKYLGYTYDVAGTQTDSTIKDVVDAWYEANLKIKYESYIADGIFCNDRSGATAGSTANGADIIEYAPYYRLWLDTTPTLMCENQSDRYTMDKEIGNGLLSNPIGLITGDEIYFAGGNRTTSNESYYLYSSEYYWTSTPDYFSSVARAFYVNARGTMSTYTGDDSNGVGHSEYKVRPVINLKSDVTCTGSGKTNDPYIIK